MNDVEEAIRTLLIHVGEDPKREGLLDTPRRIANAWLEMTSGYEEDPTAHLCKDFENDEAYDELILSRDIPFTSLCEHHGLPFSGVAHIGYIPGKDGRIVGLSKLARMFDGYARRLQVQERLTKQALDALVQLQPLGAAVIVKAQHSCQCLRGVKKDGFMVTSAMYGVFRHETLVGTSARAELMELIRL